MRSELVMSVRFASRNNDEAVQEEMRLRRLALQIAAQLPEDLGDARIVLAYTREFLEGFLVPRGLPVAAE